MAYLQGPATIQRRQLSEENLYKLCQPSHDWRTFRNRGGIHQ